MKHLFRISSEKGQSAVEFALVLPLLLVLLLGIIEFGWFLNAKITITGAAREGARHYAIHKDDEAGVINIVGDYLSLNNIDNITIDTDTDLDYSPKIAIVTVTGDVSGITGAFNGLMDVFFGGVGFIGK